MALFPSMRLCRAALRLAPAAGTGREAGMPATADRASVASYAQFPAELDRDWLGRVCHLSGADLAVIRRRTDPVTQLGYATQLGTVRAIGTFQSDPAAVPEPVVAAIARQLGIDEPGALAAYRAMPGAVAPCGRDPAYRRTIHHLLSRGERRNSLARAVFHGQRGQLRRHYQVGQENQLGSLGIMINVIVLWQTVYIQAALDHLAAKGYPIDPADVARLTPLGHPTINLDGRYRTTNRPPATGLLFSKFIPVGAWEAVYLIQGLLEQQSKVTPPRCWCAPGRPPAPAA